MPKTAQEASQYEDLLGAEGPDIFFRGQRFAVPDLCERSSAWIVIDGVSYPLFDLSMNGIAFTDKTKSESWYVGRELSVEVAVSNESAYRGSAIVVHTSQGGARIGLKFVDGFLDLPDLQALASKKVFDRTMKAGPDADRMLVPAPYREAVERAVHTMQFYRLVMGDREKSLIKRLGNADELALGVIETLTPRWLSVRDQLAEAAQELWSDISVLEAARGYTLTSLRPVMDPAAIVHRAYHKPLGYPGDYQTMLLLYHADLKGSNAFGKALNAVLCGNEQMAEGIRERAAYLAEVQIIELARLCSQQGRGLNSFRVMSVGSGPALEVSEFIEKNTLWPGSCEWTMVDQEEEALSFAYQSAYKQLARYKRPGELRCLHASFKQLLQDPEGTLRVKPQHLIYSSGLFDYLKPRIARRLITSLYRCLAPGGLLVIGNADSENVFNWINEFLMDWRLGYRTNSQMKELVDHLPGAQGIDIVKEKCRAFHFVTARKPT